MNKNHQPHPQKRPLDPTPLAEAQNAAAAASEVQMGFLPTKRVV